MSDAELNIRIKATDEATPTLNKVQDEIEETSEATEELGEKNREAEGSTKGLIVGLSGVATSAWSLYQGYDRLVDAQVGVDRAMLAAKSSANAMEDAQKRYNAVVEKYGPASAEAEASLKDLQLAQERATVAQERAEMVQGNLSESYVGFGLSIVPSVITITSNLSTVMSNLGGASGIATAAMNVMSSATGALSGAMAFLAANPIVLVIAALAALAAGLVWAYQNVGPFRDAVNSLGQLLMGAFNSAIQAIIGALTWLGGNVIQPLTGFLGDLWSTITSNPILAALFGPITTVTYLITHWGEVTQSLGEVWNSIMNAIRNAWESYVAPLASIITGFAESIRDVFQALFGWIVGGSSWVDLCRGIASNWGSVVQPLIGVAQGWASSIQGVFQSLQGAVSGIWSSITGTVQSAANSINGIVSGIMSRVQSAWSSVQSLASNASRSVSDAVSSAASTAGSIVSGVTSAVTSTLSNVVTTITKAITTTTPATSTPTVTSPAGTVIRTSSGAIRDVWARGFEGVISNPTVALIGEAGPERVSVKPLGAEATSPQGAVILSPTINVTTGSISGVEDIRQFADVIYEEMCKRVRNEIKSNAFYTRGIG